MRRVVAVTFASLFFASIATGQQVARAGTSTQSVSSQASASLTPSQIFSRARSSVVVIVATDQNGQREALGSGFIVGHDRIATNHHVVEGMNEAHVLFSDGDVKPVAKVVADSSQQDLIVLTVETGSRAPLVFGDELSLQQGDSVYALGAPKGLELTFTNGIVSSFRKLNDQFLIQTTAPIAPGSSGGPLFDRTGRVVGVTTSMLADTPGIYFSVGVGDVRRLLRKAGGVVVSFAEWAKQQDIEHNSESRSAVASSATQGEQTTTPSLEETLSWMKSFLEAHGQEREPRTGSSQSNSMGLLTKALEAQAAEHGCTVYFFDHSYSPGVQRHTDMTTPTRTSTDYIRLGDIDSSSIRSSDSHVYFETTNNLDKIVELVPTDHDGETFSHYDLNTGYLVFDSSGNAQLFATAFKHAVSLCVNAKAPF